MPPSPNPSRILIVRLSHLGDVVHALPVYHALRATRPDAELAWVVQPEFAGLLEGLPGLSRVIHFDRRGGIGAWPRLRRQLRGFAADWAIDAQGNWKSAAVTRLSGARRRSGFHRSEGRERLAWTQLNDRVPPTPLPAPVHALERSLHLARTLTGLPGDWLPDDWLGLTATERLTGEQRWREYFGVLERGGLLLQLAAEGDPRAWPETHQRELLVELAAAELPTLALSGPGEAELGARLGVELATELGRVPHLRHWIGQRGLRELAAFFTVAAERGARLVCCDSGPLHLAVACGLPVLALAGPQDPRRTGPWSPGGRPGPHRVLLSIPPTECAPCLARECALPQGAICMSNITPRAVLEALLATDPRSASPAS